MTKTPKFSHYIFVWLFSQISEDMSLEMDTLQFGQQQLNLSVLTCNCFRTSLVVHLLKRFPTKAFESNLEQSGCVLSTSSWH